MLKSLLDEDEDENHAKRTRMIGMSAMVKQMDAWHCCRAARFHTREQMVVPETCEKCVQSVFWRCQKSAAQKKRCSPTVQKQSGLCKKSAPGAGAAQKYRFTLANVNHNRQRIVHPCGFSLCMVALDVLQTSAQCASQIFGVVVVKIALNASSLSSMNIA